ncbi:MAG: SWEET family sugar transporter [archaeon]|nr:SWEET family sugar transporter [archaeon]
MEIILRKLEEETTKELIARYISYFGTAIGVCLNLSPVVMFYEHFKGRRKVREFPELFFYMNLLNNVANLSNGVVQDSAPLQISSWICLSIGFVWTFLYHFIRFKKIILKMLLFDFISANLTFEVMFILTVVLDWDFSLKFLAVATVALTIFNNAAPAQNVLEIFKTGNYNLIPIWTTCFGFLCTLCWTIYAMFASLPTVGRIGLLVSNGISIFINVAQIAIWVIYYNKAKTNPPKIIPDEGEEGGENKAEVENKDKEEGLIEGEKKE